MALDLSGFVTPEQKFEGLYKLGEEFAAKRKAEAKAAEEAKAEKATMSTMLQKMVDPKDYLSGAPTDPQVVKGFNDVYQEGINLINQNKGMNNAMLSAALFPQINKLAQYGTAAKVIKKNLDESLKNYDKNYYNIPTLKEKALNKIYFNDDGTQKDISEVSFDPSYLDDVVRENAPTIVNSRVVSDMLSKYPNIQNVATDVTRGKDDRLISTTKNVTYKPYEQLNPETGEFEPMHELATDAGTPIKHNGEFIKVIPENIYNDMRMRGGKPFEDWINGQAQLHLKEYQKQQVPTAGAPLESTEIDINSPQAELVKRNILHDLLYQNRTAKQINVKKDIQRLSQRKGGGNNYYYGGAGRGQGEQAQGLVLDEIGKTAPLKLQNGQYTVENGNVSDSQGNPYNGEIYVSRENLPTSLKTIMKAGGIDIGKGVNFVVEDGVIQAAKTKQGITDRNAIWNYQQKWNTESQKAPQPGWGARIANAAKGAMNTVKKAVTPKQGGVKGTSKNIFKQ
jgi:hypothetical protein